MAKISESTLNVLERLRNVMGETNNVVSLKPDNLFNKDDGKVLELNAKAPENINEELEKQSFSSISNEQEESEIEESEQAEFFDPEIELQKIKDNLEKISKETFNSPEGNYDEFLAEDDEIFSNQTDDIEKTEESDDIIEKNKNLKNLSDNKEVKDDKSTDILERNWQDAVKEELKDIISFADDDYSDNEIKQEDLDSDFGIDKIDNIKSVMESTSKDNILSNNAENIDPTKSESNKLHEVVDLDDDFPDNNADNLSKTKFDEEYKSKSNKSIISHKTFNRTKNIIDSFKTKVEENISHNPQKAMSNDGNKTLEEFVKQLVEPMLKEWLDNNLSDIVEEAVENEIKKLSEKDNN